MKDKQGIARGKCSQCPDCSEYQRDVNKFGSGCSSCFCSPLQHAQTSFGGPSSPRELKVSGGRSPRGHTSPGGSSTRVRSRVRMGSRAPATEETSKKSWSTAHSSQTSSSVCAGSRRAARGILLEYSSGKWNP